MIDINTLFSGNVVVATREKVLEMLRANHVSNQWWDISEERRRVLTTYIIRNLIPFRQVTSIGEGDDNCAGTNIKWRNGSCLSNMLLRCAKLRIPTKEHKKCYYMDETTHCYAEEHWNLPCYAVCVTGYKSDGSVKSFHGICSMRVKEDINDFKSWVFFQYNNPNITPGSWQMPNNSDVDIEEIEDAGCSWMRETIIASWHVNGLPTVAITFVANAHANLFIDGVSKGTLK